MKKIDWNTVQLDGVDTKDYPDFSDAFFTYAEWDDGTPLTEDELDQMGEDYYSELNEMAYMSLI